MVVDNTFNLNDIKIEVHDSLISLIFIPLTQILQYLLKNPYPSLHNTVDAHLFQAIFDSHQHIKLSVHSPVKKKEMFYLIINMWFVWSSFNHTCLID